MSQGFKIIAYCELLFPLPRKLKPFPPTLLSLDSFATKLSQLGMKSSQKWHMKTIDGFNLQVIELMSSCPSFQLVWVAGPENQSKIR